MGLIIGMDIWVFTAWIGTILVTIFCVIYGIYHQFLKKSDEKITSKRKEEHPQKKEDD